MKAAVPDATRTLSATLKAETAPVHEAMHVLMGALDPFADRSRYARFVWAQHAFQREVRRRCHGSRLHAMVPDLDVRGREAAAEADIADLRDVLPPQWLENAARATVPSADSDDDLSALGWLYVSEGSTLGAAFLLKEAQARLGVSEIFGARNLAAAPQGRARAWRAFVDAIDAADLTPPERQRAVAGAHAAFAWFATTLRRAFADLALPIPAHAA